MHRWNGNSSWYRRRLQAFPVMVLLMGCVDGVGDGDEACESGCGIEGTCGERGVLRFADASDDPVFSGGDAPMVPLAVGGRFSVRLYPAPEDSEPVAPASASIDDAAVRVVDTDDLVHLSAEAEGSGLLSVTTEDGLEDRIEVTARPVASVRPRIKPAIFTEQTLTLGEPDSVTPEFGLLPGATVDISALLLTDDDIVLGGYELVSWSSSDAAVIALSGAGLRSDAVMASAVAEGTASVSTADGNDVTLQVVTPTAAESLVLYEPLVDAPDGLVPWTGTVEVTPDEDRAVVALAHDGSGRVLVAPDTETFDFTVTGDAAAVDVENAGWPNAIVIHALAPGDATIEVTHLGLQASVAVHVP